MEPVTQPENWHGGKVFYFNVTLISLAIMMLEIGLTRVFSVMFESHYVFLVLSLAVLGLGCGGIYVHKRVGIVSNPDLKPFYNLLPISSGLMALSILIMTIFVTKVSIFQHIYIAALLAFVPFFFGGIFLTAAFCLFPDQSSKIYAADLIGASIGAFLIVVVLKLGGINVMLFVAVIASIPAALFSIKESLTTLKKMAFLLLTGAFIAIFIINYSSNFLGTIPLTKGAHKEMAHMLGDPISKAKVVESRWNAFGRTDLIAVEEYPDEMVFFIDGTAGSAMYRFDGDPSSLEIPEFVDFAGYFPIKLLSEKEKKKALIIGPGGGREVLISLLGGVKEITAVEVNKDLVDLMKKYSDFNGGIYNGFPGVKVVVEEGRNFIRATKEKYDIIMLSIPVTKTSRSPEGFALTENFLFTSDSINDYLDRLNTDGRLIVVAHDDIEILRLVFTSLSALGKRGIRPSAAMKHIYTLGSETFPVFVLKKSPLTLQEAQNVHLGMHESDYATNSSFIPFTEQATHTISLGEGIYEEHPMLNQALYLISQDMVTPEEFIEVADFNLRSVSDNDPFFYKFDIGLPPIITFLLTFSIMALIWGWLIRPAYPNQDETPWNNTLFLLLFSFLGIGFMLIEIPLIQKFILFLGQPVYAVAMLLFSLLIGAGIGSWISGVLWKQGTTIKLRLAAFMVSLIVVIYILFLNQSLVFFLGASFWVRILVSLLLLLPLGFFMGMPFPLGMKLLSEFGLENYVPRMWAVNGIGSVLGSALSIALSISFGFSYAMTLGALLYFSIFILFSRWNESLGTERQADSFSPKLGREDF